MKTSALLVIAVLLPLCAPLAATPAAPQLITTNLGGSDLLFLSGATRATALIAALSGLASKQAVTPEIRALAASSEKEQTASSAQLTALSARKGLPPSETLDSAGRKTLQSLHALTGLKFDKSFVLALTAAEQSLQTSLETGAASADKDIQATAQSALATLKLERDRARKLGF